MFVFLQISADWLLSFLIGSSFPFPFLVFIHFERLLPRRRTILIVIPTSCSHTTLPPQCSYSSTPFSLVVGMCVCVWDDGRLSRECAETLQRISNYDWPRIGEKWVDIAKPYQAHDFSHAHWMLANSRHLFAFMPCPFVCLFTCCVAIITTRESVQSCLPHRLYTLYDCSPSPVSSFSSPRHLSLFIDPTLAKIVNYSPFIRVSRIRCLKKKEMSVS